MWNSACRNNPVQEFEVSGDMRGMKESRKPDNRRTPRHVIEAEAAVKPIEGSASFAATAVNVSASGIYLKAEREIALAVGDEVNCEVKAPPGEDLPHSSWGIGRIVRVEGCGAAVELTAGIFHPHSEPGDERPPLIDLQCAPR
jgi:hypothetical protein